HLFHHYLLFADCFRSRLLRVEQENDKLKHMVEDLKIIDRAKILLVTCLNMSEEQAHRYLEKQAMDMQTSKLAVAKQVIRTYQN
ncbi:MAG: ANTAR domain-containing protein, partial [Ruminococcus sp.]|nr:ANTAR domain-containing protein [Ruminococcus sp.]